MLKKLQIWSLSTLAVVLITVAHSGVGNRSLFILYEPDIPESLKSKD